MTLLYLPWLKLYFAIAYSNGNGGARAILCVYFSRTWGSGSNYLNLTKYSLYFSKEIIIIVIHFFHKSWDSIVIEEVIIVIVIEFVIDPNSLNGEITDFEIVLPVVTFHFYRVGKLVFKVLIKINNNKRDRWLKC